MYRWISGVVAVAVALGVGIGCGGGSDETNSDVTKTQFIKQADRVCADSKAERLAIGEEEFNPKQRQGSHTVGGAATKALEAELEELAEELLTKKIVPSLESQQEKLESLGVPAGDDAKLKKMLTNMEKAIGELEKEGYKGLVGNEFDVFEKEAEGYGLSCKVI